MTTKSDPDWLSVREVGRRLSVSEWQVRQWIQAGQFDIVVCFSQRVTRIAKESYDRFIERNRQAVS